MERDSFVFYRSFYEAIKDLDDAKKATLFDAICDLALNGNEPKFDAKFDTTSKSIFTLIKPQILANTERYKNGAKSRAKITTRQPNVNENENVNVNDNDIYEHFEKIWEIYPVKKGKSKAETYFFSWIKGRQINGRIKRLTDKDMWYAVQTYLKELEETKQDLQFVPYGSTFFNTKIYDYYEIWREKNNVCSQSR